MALSALAKKQGWLVDNGHPKSYAYFMTGPNLGPDFDVDKLVAGGYSQFEIDGFVGDTQGAYNAHKTKAKVKGPAVPKAGTVPISGNACAKGAVKAVNTWVTAGQEVLANYMNKVGSKFLAKNVSAADLQTVGHEIEASRKAVVVLLQEAKDQVGILSPEYKALRALHDSLDQVRLTLRAKEASDQLFDALQEGNIFVARSKLDELQKISAQFKTRNFDDVAPLWENALAEKIGVQQFDEIEKIALEALEQQHKRAVGNVLQSIVEEADTNDDFLQFAELLESTFNKSPSTVYDDTIAIIDGLGQVDVALINGEPILQNLRGLDVFSRGWNDFLGLDGAVIPRKQLHDSMGRVLQTAVDDAVDKSITTYKGLVNQYANDTLDDFWLAADIDGVTPLEVWATKTGGADITEALFDEVEEFQKILLFLSDQGVIPEEAVGKFIADSVLAVSTDVAKALDNAVVKVGLELPGVTATPPSVLAKLEDPGHHAVISLAGTDELNPIVTSALQEIDEPGSLTYFMTKKQKVDFLTDPNFGITSYTVKFKGDEITGVGLETAKAKYAAKTGKTLTDTAKAVNKTPIEVTIDPIAKMPNLLPSAPKWYADTASPAQTGFYFKLLDQLQDSQPSVHAEFIGVTSGQTINKGQISAYIDLLKDNALDAPLPSGQFVQIAKQIQKSDTFDDFSAYHAKWLAEQANETKTAKLIATSLDDVDTVAGKTAKLKKASPLGEADAPQQVANDAQYGPTVSGQEQKLATSVSPDVPAWDKPHSYTYEGDAGGMGGAHRKWLFQDENGDRWMLKNAEGFRADGEVAAHKIAQMAGFDIAEARVSTQTIGGNKVRGFMQRLFKKGDIEGELADVVGGVGYAGLEVKTVRQIQQHQVLDWLIGNHDSHNSNFLILRDGRVVGIDKGQAFKHYGTDQLAHDYRPVGNPQKLAYEDLWNDYRRGSIDIDLDAIDEVLQRIEAIDDAELRATLQAYAEGRFKAGNRAGFLPGTTANNAEELIEQIIDRKNHIRLDFEKFYFEQAKERGVKWTPAWNKPPPKVVQDRVFKAGDILTPITDDFAQGVRNTGAQGKALYVGGTDVEKGQIMFDVVLDRQQPTIRHEKLRINVKLRPDAQAKMERIIAEEGGSKVAAQSYGGPSIAKSPLEVQAAQTFHTTSVNAAKTINSHISSGDFAFNASTITDTKNKVIKAKALAGKFVDDGVITDAQIKKILFEVGDDLDAAAVKIDELAGEIIEAKAAKQFLPNLEAAVEQSAKDASATKVGFVDGFDAEVQWKRLSEDATDRAEAFAGAKVGKVVEVEEPIEIMRDYDRFNVFQTRSLEPISDANPIQFEGPVHKINGIERGTTVAKADLRNGQELTVRYNGAEHHVNQKGWLELEVSTKSGTLEAEDIEAVHRFLVDRLGIDADLATSKDMELTYWRFVHGSYKQNDLTGDYLKASKLGDERLGALGPSPTKDEEIEAIRSAYRDAFGNQVDDADFLPVHGRMMNETLEEAGLGEFERPELLAAEIQQAYQGQTISHSMGYGGGSISENNLSGATGFGWHGQQQKTQLGLGSSAASNSSDVAVGGSDALFAKQKFYRGSSTWWKGDFAIVNPGRRARIVGDYATDYDAFGNLKVRSEQSKLALEEVSRLAKESGNQYMLRNFISLSDDIEMLMFTDRRTHRLFIDEYTRRTKSSTWRGVPWEDRFQLKNGVDDDLRVERFFKKYVEKNLGNRLRTKVDDYLGGIGESFDSLKSNIKRLKKKGSKLTKKLSKGREGKVWATVKNGHSEGKDGYRGIFVRYHTSENALSIPTETIQKFQLFESTMDKHFAQVNIVGPKGDEIAATVFDMSVFEIDLKVMGKYERDRFFGEFVEAMSNNTVEDMITRWGGNVSGVL